MFGKQWIGVRCGADFPLSFFVLLTFLFCGNVFADQYSLFYVDTNRVSYTGSVSQYDTFADAQAGTNANGTYSITPRPGDPPYNTSNRDVVMMIWSNGANGYAYDFNQFYTNYSSPNGQGTGNPNLTPEGVIGVWHGGFGTGAEGFFHGFDGTNYTEYTLQVTGVNLGNGILWNAPVQYPNPTLSDIFARTQGTFLSYQMDVTFGGLEGTVDTKYGGIDATNNPAWVDGTFRGIFQNSTDGYFYVADFTFGMDNWAYAHGSSNPAIGSEFWGYAQPDPMPEPSALLLAALGLSGIVLLRVSSGKRRDQEATH